MKKKRNHVLDIAKLVDEYHDPCVIYESMYSIF